VNALFQPYFMLLFGDTVAIMLPRPGGEHVIGKAD